MTSSEIRHASFLDLLFDNRNKDYGAYALRKYYPQRLVLAMCVALLLSVLLLCFIEKNNNTTNSGFVKPDPDDVLVHTQVIPEQPKQPAPPKPDQPHQPAATVAQKTATQIRITPNPVTITDVPAQTDLTDVAISTKTAAGVPANTVPAITETGAGTKPQPEEKPAGAPAYTAPQFPGGAAAWALFLRRNLQAPDALEEGEKKTVLVNFLVSEDGSVTGFDVVQSGGVAFDAEVIRVLKKMPKWKPALRYGVPAAVSFTQPVTFVAMGD